MERKIEGCVEQGQEGGMEGYRMQGRAGQAVGGGGVGS